MKKYDFNEGWFFYRQGDAEHTIQVQVPHDAMLCQRRIPKLKNGSYTGFFPSGDYWYEKKFYGKEEYINKTVLLEFEGIYMDSEIYLNGNKVGGHSYGYNHFYVNLTDRIQIGSENDLRVFVHCSQVPNARWYPGNGIYRPVHLYVSGKTYLGPESIRIQTISTEPAVIHVETEISGDRESKLQLEILDEGKVVARAEGESCDIRIPKAKLWDVKTPNLYRLQARLIKDGGIIDTAEQIFGVRSLSWDVSKGFFVNGKSVKLKGGCLHHDNGILGAKDYKAAAYRKIKKLKEAGFNAIRSSHYPISKNLLKACDELGMYIMDEAFDYWEESTGLYGYTFDFHEQWEMDLKAMIAKDYNHPSVIMYSIGNEISDTATPEGVKLAHRMTELCHEMDASRPVTVCPNIMMNMLAGMGISLSIGDAKAPKRDDVVDPLEENKDSAMGGSAMINIIVALVPAIMKFLMKPERADKGVRDVFEKVDIAGYNYGSAVYEGHHRLHPDRIIVGSENMPSDVMKNWKLVEEHPYVIGDFMWTAWDYLGEGGAGVIDYGKKTGSFIKPYPIISANTGVFDLIGYKETMGHVVSIVWGAEKKPYISVRPMWHNGEKVHYSGYRSTDAIACWTFPGYEGEKAEIQVYGAGARVELFSNGKLAGKALFKQYRADFQVLYEPGELEAVVYDAHDNILSKGKLQTAGDETVLTMTTDRSVIAADGEDLAFIDVEITDREGVLKCMEEKCIHAEVTGAGTLEAVGSGNPRTTENYLGDSFTTYLGRMQVVVRSTKAAGNITVKVWGQGLDEKEITIQTK